MSHFPEVRKILHYQRSGYSRDRHYIMSIQIHVKAGIKKMFLPEDGLPRTKLKFANVIKDNNVAILKPGTRRPYVQGRAVHDGVNVLKAPSGDH